MLGRSHRGIPAPYGSSNRWNTAESFKFVGVNFRGLSIFYTFVGMQFREHFLYIKLLCKWSISLWLEIHGMGITTKIKPHKVSWFHSNGGKSFARNAILFVPNTFARLEIPSITCMGTIYSFLMLDSVMCIGYVTLWLRYSVLNLGSLTWSSYFVTGLCYSVSHRITGIFCGQKVMRFDP